MAGGTFAFVVLMIILLCVGFFGVAAGIVGIILFNLARKKGKKFGKPLIAVSAVVLALSVLITALPIGWGVFLFKMNTDIPEEYVETAIVIEENGYQDKAFTADGVRYERIEIESMYAHGEEYFSNPIFSYKEEGFVNRDLWGNYYELENEHGFNIVVGNSGEIFCPVDEKEEVTAFYSDDNNFVWWLCDDDYALEKKVGSDEQKVLNELFELYNSNPDTISVKADWDGEKEYWFDFVSKDNLFIKDSISVWEIDDKCYLEISMTADNLDDYINVDCVKIDDASAKKLIDSLN